jgi:hypothetical protein
MLKFTPLIERTDLVSGETCVTVCVVVRGIQRGRMIHEQRERKRKRDRNRTTEGGAQ